MMRKRVKMEHYSLIDDLNLVQKHLDHTNFDAAFVLYQKIAHLYPDSYEGWLGLLCTDPTDDPNLLCHYQKKLTSTYQSDRKSLEALLLKTYSKALDHLALRMMKTHANYQSIAHALAARLIYIIDL